jgi:hypothetical protein
MTSRLRAFLYGRENNMYEPMTPAVAHPNVTPPRMRKSVTFICSPELAQSYSTTTNGVPLIQRRTGVRSELRLKEGTLGDSSAWLAQQIGKVPASTYFGDYRVNQDLGA